MTRTLKAALQAALGLVTAGCAGLGYGGPRRDPRLAAAWPASERGDLAEATRRGVELAARNPRPPTLATSSWRSSPTPAAITPRPSPSTVSSGQATAR